MIELKNKKSSIVFVLKVLEAYSDSNHPLKQETIIEKIKTLYGVHLERKSIASSIRKLNELGYDIVKTRKGCYLNERLFEPSEANYLIDAVFSSKSITDKQSRDLVRKIGETLSVYDRKKFDYVFKSSELSRSNNKQIFYNIDVVSEAISKNLKISFNYNQYNLSGDLVSKKNGKKYIVNPYFMVNSQGHYYLVCNYDYFDEMGNYKMELITNIQLINEPAKPITQIKGYQSGFDVSKYINEKVYLFAGESVRATIKVEDENCISLIYEWFGKDSKVVNTNGKILATVFANENALIYWCVQYSEWVELIEPNSTRMKIKDLLSKSLKKYT